MWLLDNFKLHIWLLNYIFLFDSAALSGGINHVSEIDYASSGHDYRET